MYKLRGVSVIGITKSERSTLFYTLPSVQEEETFKIGRPRGRLKACYLLRNVKFFFMMHLFQNEPLISEFRCEMTQCVIVFNVF